jgi:hypothetical protein
MPNTILTPEEITRETLFLLKNSCKLVSLVYKDHAQEFGREGHKIGDTIKVRKPARYVGGDSPLFEPEEMTEDYIYAKLQKYAKVHMSYSSSELYLDIDQFSERHLKPAAVALGNKLDRALASTMALNTANAVGVPGSLPDELRTYLQAGQKLTEMGCPEDIEKYIMMNAASRVEIIDALKGLMQDASEVGRQYRTGRMGKTAGFTWYEDENIVRRTNGVYSGTPRVKGANQADATLLSDGWGLDTALKQGDVFTIDGVYAVNPQHRESTGSLAQFVVTADIEDTAGEINIPIMVAGGTGVPTATGQFKNISNLPADDALITIMGQSGIVGPENLAFVKSAFGFISAPLPKSNVGECYVETDPDTGISVRYLRQHSGAAVTTAGGAPTDAWIIRLDVLYDMYPIYPELCCRVRG